MKHLQHIQAIALLAIIISCVLFISRLSGEITSTALLPTGTQQFLAQAVAPTSGLVSLYTFDDGTALDTAGGNTGTITGGTVIPGKVGTSALQLNGVDGAVSLGQSPLYDFSSTNSFTVALWAYPGTSAKKVLFSRGGTFSSSGEIFYISKHNSYADRWYASVGTSEGSIEFGTAATTVDLNQWQHVALVWDGGTHTVSLYKNGQVIGSMSTTSAVTILGGSGTTALTAIGKDAKNNRYFWDGSIDDVRLYNRALGASEISSLYNLGASNNVQAPVSSTHLTKLYVSPTGNDSNTGAETQPLLTLNKALTKVLPGDSVYLMPGVHVGDALTLVNGTVDKPIVIEGAGVTQTTYSGNLSIRNSYYQFKNIRVQSNYLGLTGSNATNILVTNSEFTAGSFGIQFESDASGGSPAYVTISNNSFYQMQGTMIILGGHDNIITQNTFRDSNGWDAIHAWGRNNTISQNRFLRITADQLATSGNHADIIQTWDTSTHAASTGLIFERNYIQDCTSQLGNLEKGTADIGDWTFRNNVIVNSRIQLNTYIPNVKVYNNTVYGTPATFTNGFRFASDPVKGISTGGQVYNNILIGDGGYYSNGSPQVTADYNIVSNLDGSPKSLVTPEVHGINGGFIPANIFANLTSDMHLKSGSMAINSGMALNFSNDYEGVIRPQSGVWDRGAYEYTGYVSNPSPSTPIAGDFNNDGAVNSLDLSLMYGAWNTNNAAYDLTKDGTVNTLDYSMMVKNWTL